MIHENIEKIRKARGITKTYLANEIGLSLQGYRHIANGDTKLTVDRLKIIANALNVDITIFFDTKLTENVILGLQRR